MIYPRSFTSFVCKLSTTRSQFSWKYFLLEITPWASLFPLFTSFYLFLHPIFLLSFSLWTLTTRDLYVSLTTFVHATYHCFVFRLSSSYVLLLNLWSHPDPGKMDVKHYQLRMGMFYASFVLGLYTHKYVCRYRENEKTPICCGSSYSFTFSC